MLTDKKTGKDNFKRFHVKKAIVGQRRLLWPAALKDDASGQKVYTTSNYSKNNSKNK